MMDKSVHKIAHFSYLFLCLVFFFVCLLGHHSPVFAWTENDEPILTKILSGYTDDGELNYPKYIALDSTENIFISDTNNYRIQVFDSSGNYLYQFGSYGNEIGEFRSITGIGVDSQDRIYVADNNCRIQKFSASGDYLAQFGSCDSSSGDYLYPLTIYVDKQTDLIYVFDLFSRNIKVFDENGILQTSFLTTISYSQGIVTDPLGNIFLGDHTGDRIMKYSSSGSLLLNFSVSSTCPRPNGIVVKPSGQIIVASYGWAAVCVYSPTGIFQSRPITFGYEEGRVKEPYGLSLDNGNQLYVSDMFNNRIQIFNNSYAFVLKIGSDVTQEGNFVEPRDLDIDSSGNVYVVSVHNHSVQKFTSNGEFIYRTGVFGSGPLQFSYPNGVGIDKDDNVYVADSVNHRIQKISPSGVFLGQFMNSFNTPRDVAVDSSLNIYVADSGNNRIVKLSSSGAFLNAWTGIGYTPKLYIDKDDNLFFTDSGQCKIRKINSIGELSDVFGFCGLGDSNFEMYYPQAVTKDERGNYYVSEPGLARIKKFSSSGEFLMKFGDFGPHSEGFQTPIGLVYDSLGNRVLVSDSMNHRIKILSFDVLPPSGLFLINNNQVLTNSNILNIDIDATDELSGMGYYMVSEDSGFMDASWQEFEPNQTYQVSEGDGEKTIYLKIRDNRTNDTDLEPKTITVDTTPPILQSFGRYSSGINLRSRQVVKTNPYIILLNATDNLSGVDYINFYIDEHLVCTVTEANSEGLYECLWDTNMYRTDIRVEMFDVAGNQRVIEFDDLVVNFGSGGGGTVDVEDEIEQQEQIGEEVEQEVDIQPEQIVTPGRLVRTGMDLEIKLIISIFGLSVVFIYLNKQGFRKYQIN